MIITLLAFVFVLGIIIFVHEFGHLITAKAFGMRVFVFSFGFGKRLAGFKWGDTDCRLSAVPLGGYVKLEGEPDDRLSEDTSAVVVGDGRDFTSRPRWQRFLVYLAGPAMNALLTISLLTVFYMIGMAIDASRFDRPIVGKVDEGSPAAVAGIQTGDEIVSIEGERPETWEDALYDILVRPGKKYAIRVRRGAEEREVEVVAQSTTAEKVGSIGVHPLVRIGEVRKGQPAEAAGFKPDDAILRIGDKPIGSFGEIFPIVGSSEGKSLDVLVLRNGEPLTIAVTPKDSGEGPKIGVGPKTMIKKFGPGAAFVEACRWAWDMTLQTFDIVKRLVTAQLSPKAMMGPLGIAQASGDAAREGWDRLVFLVAVISLQVGLFNLFPLAPLDGGHLAILAGEGLLRRDFSMAVKIWIMNAGAAVMLLLIGLALYSDLSKTALFGKFLP
ncbi:MAG TPA: RIP metalloprotease RseP [Vicinamibacteria bacterium]|jgi:regulator of sigma E protease